MKRNYNEQAFTPEDVEKGLLNDLLDYLLDHNTKSEDSFYDIHITTDGYCTIVEWTDYNHEYCPGKFEFVGEDEHVMKEVLLPDNTIQYVFDEDEEKELFDTFLEENPEFYQDEYGRWHNKNEEDVYKSLLDSVEED